MCCNSVEFGRAILRHYDPTRPWKSDAAKQQFFNDIPRAFTDLHARAALGWNHDAGFFDSVACFVIDSMLPNLHDSEQGYTYRAVEDILAKARLEPYWDAPSREVREFRFYRAAKSVPALVAFLSECWACPLVTAER